MARPPGTTYQLTKFARRHRRVVAGVAGVFVVLASVLLGSWLTIRTIEAKMSARYGVCAEVSAMAKPGYSR